MGKKEDRAEQFGLIPLKAKWCSPSKLGSADLKEVCRCDDGSDYAIKKNEPHPHRSRSIARTAHNEFFCYRLGHIVGIASPNHHIVEINTGQLVFGSRFESGLQDKWWDDVIHGKIPQNEIMPTLARIYAFDLFVHNVDRHANNLIVRKQHFGYSAIAFDYSRAWSFHGIPPPPLPMSPSENTIVLQRQLSRHISNYVDAASTSEVLENLEAIDGTVIKKILDQQPDSWLTKVESQAIIDWWVSPRKNERISAIRDGIKDGSLL